jgi:hypothetical protein
VAERPKGLHFESHAIDQVSIVEVIVHIIPRKTKLEKLLPPFIHPSRWKAEVDHHEPAIRAGGPAAKLQTSAF